jgi:PAS domain S-box-containing protein
LTFSGLLSKGVLPASLSSGGLDVEMARDWACAFVDQTIEHAFLLLDLDLNILWANPCAGKILGMPASQIVGSKVHRFFTDDDRNLGIPEYEAIVSASFGSSDDDRWMLRADGSRFWATGRTIALVDAEGAKVGAAKIFRSQTDLKMQIETLRNRVAALTEAEDVRNAAMATLSHELRNPLSILNLAVTLIGRLAGDERLAPQLRTIETNVALIARLLGDLDQACAPTVDRLSLQTEMLALTEVLESALSTTIERMGHPPRSIELILPPGQPIYLEGDRSRLHQIFVNLIGNAVKFTSENGRVWIKGSTEGRQVVVRVEDDGIGIAPDMLETIFGLFTRAELAAAHAGGMGIGLSLVKTLIELHGGSVQARSDGLGHGAEFAVRLPLVQNAGQRSHTSSV